MIKLYYVESQFFDEHGYLFITPYFVVFSEFARHSDDYWLTSFVDLKSFREWMVIKPSDFKKYWSVKFISNLD